jgi:Integrase core domain
MVCSMSRRGNCWDNAVAESFFATLKVELVRDATWATRARARTELFEYLEVFHNGQRRHSTLGYLSPRAFEQTASTASIDELTKVSTKPGQVQLSPRIVKHHASHLAHHSRRGSAAAERPAGISHRCDSSLGDRGKDCLVCPA